mmetsp:Transcript_35572/g.83122  ORF Transcript_35572/g.83122 Transcript_35572/m.83122 type:complete len:283 (+) Transcript_35572:86-934(+)
MDALRAAAVILLAGASSASALAQQTRSDTGLQSVVLSGYDNPRGDVIDGTYLQRNGQSYSVNGRATFWDGAGEHFIYWCAKNSTWGVARQSSLEVVKHGTECPAFQRHPTPSAVTNAQHAAPASFVEQPLPPERFSTLQAESHGNALASTPVTTGVQQILEQSQQRTTQLQHRVSEMLQSSTQQVQTITSMLMTNSRQTAALNTLYAEMEQLTQRLAKFQGAMDQCREDLREAEQRSGQAIVAGDGTDPLLGGASSFFQLQMHATALDGDLAELTKLSQQPL